MKVCSKCGTSLDYDLFSKDKRCKDGLRSECKLCQSAYSKKYINENKSSIYKQNSERYYDNIEERRLYQINYYKNTKERRKKDINKNQLKYVRRKLKTDYLFKLKRSIRSLICMCIKNNGFKKQSKTAEILGCSYDEFKLYIESKFEDWMTWDNKGMYNGELNYGWDLDHIIPISSAKTEEEIIKLNHYTNFQPLCSYTNRHIKKDNITQ